MAPMSMGGLVGGGSVNHVDPPRPQLKSFESSQGVEGRDSAVVWERKSEYIRNLQQGGESRRVDVHRFDPNTMWDQKKCFYIIIEELKKEKNRKIITKNNIIKRKDNMWTMQHPFYRKTM